MSKVEGIQVDYIKLNRYGYLSFDPDTGEISISNINLIKKFIGSIISINSTPAYYGVFNHSTLYAIQISFDFHLGGSTTVTSSTGATITSVNRSNNLLTFNYTNVNQGVDKLVFHLYSSDNTVSSYYYTDITVHDISKPIGTKAVSFPDNGKYLTLSQITLNSIVDLTYSFWIRPHSIPLTDQGYITSNSTSPSTDYGGVTIFFNKMKMWGSVSDANNINDTITTANVWHHIGLIKTGTQLKYYYNFNEVNSTNVTEANIFNLVLTELGRFQSFYSGKCDMANFQVYATPLGVAEMRSLAYVHLEQSAADDYGAIANYTLDNTFNSTINGYSTTNSHGCVFVNI